MPLNLTEVLVDILNYCAHIIKETIKFSHLPNQHLLWGEIQTDSSHSIFLLFLNSQPLFCWMALCSKLTLPPHQYCMACILSHGPLPFTAQHLFWIPQNSKCIQGFNLTLLWTCLYVTSWHIFLPWILIQCNFDWGSSLNIAVTK
jgi:hypothetical protein